MKRPSLIFLFFLILFTGSLARLDRYFLKHNDGFCIRNIFSTLPYNAAWETFSSPPKQIFGQTFFYLTKGHQSYVFVSKDGNYVLKFYRFPSHLRPLPWINHPLSYHLSSRRREIKDYNMKKLDLSFESYKIADRHLKEESALVYVHLNPTAHLRRTITLIDRLGASYNIPLDKMYFVLQRRADLIFPTLERLLEHQEREKAERLIKSVVHLVASQYRKGICNEDPILEKNYGCIGERAICLDVGRFTQKPSKLPLLEEVHRTTHTLASWLQEKDAKLFETYQKELSIL